MRDVKYRGKSTSSGRWVYGYFCYDWDSKGELIPFIQSSYTEFATSISKNKVDPETVGEFTGITDINGNEIYEGDCDAVGNVVEFVNGSFCLNGDRPLTSRFIKAGNIYEQKESI